MRAGMVYSSPTSFTSSRSPLPEDPLSSLPIVESTVALRGYKQGWLHLDGKGVYLTGSQKTDRRHAYEIEQTCICAKEEGDWHHFDVKCSCGFYYSKTRRLVLDQGYDGNVIIEAELFGTVVEGTKAYRAERQRLVCVHITNNDLGLCGGWLCKAPASYVGLSSSVNMQRGNIPEHGLVPLCKGHSQGWDPMRVVSLADMTAAVGCEVRWDSWDVRRSGGWSGLFVCPVCNEQGDIEDHGECMGLSS